MEIRKARLKQLGMPTDASYGLRDQVKAELTTPGRSSPSTRSGP